MIAVVVVLSLLGIGMSIAVAWLAGVAVRQSRIANDRTRERDRAVADRHVVVSKLKELTGWELGGGVLDPTPDCLETAIEQRDAWSLRARAVLRAFSLAEEQRASAMDEVADLAVERDALRTRLDALTGLRVVDGSDPTSSASSTSSTSSASSASSSPPSPTPEPDRDLLASVAAIQASGVSRGQLWCHHRSGDLYAIVAVGICESTLAPNVMYELSRGGGPAWIRPLEEFLGQVQYDRGFVPRFYCVRSA